MLGSNIELVFKGVSIMNDLGNGIRKMIADSAVEKLKNETHQALIPKQENFIKKDIIENGMPYKFMKGDRVSWEANKEKDNDYDVLGFYDKGEIVDENTSHPLNKSYGVRIKNRISGNEYPVNANWLKLFK